jgi:hypothetical protein
VYAYWQIGNFPDACTVHSFERQKEILIKKLEQTFALAFLLDKEKTSLGGVRF